LLLAGRGLLRGHVLSHDQIEAALMRRGGYDVRLFRAGRSSRRPPRPRRWWPPTGLGHPPNAVILTRGDSRTKQHLNQMHRALPLFISEPHCAASK
jgi:hypothetical protein